MLSASTRLSIGIETVTKYGADILTVTMNMVVVIACLPLPAITLIRPLETSRHANISQKRDRDENIMVDLAFPNRFKIPQLTTCFLIVFVLFSPSIFSFGILLYTSYVG